MEQALGWQRPAGPAVMIRRWSEQTGEGVSRPRLLGRVWRTVGPPLRWGPKRRGRFEEMLAPVRAQWLLQKVF